LIDLEFARFGNILASKYNITKESGSVQPILAKDVATGESLFVTPGYKIHFTEPKTEVNDKIISASHYDKKRAINEIKRLVKKVENRNIQEEEIKIEMIEDNRKRDFLIDQSIEPNLLLRSVCKTVINLYLHKTSDVRNCLSIIQFLKEDIENRFCWFLDLGISSLKYDKAPYHILLIRGERKSKILYAYFEIFGEVGFIILINGNFKGENLEINYTFDPVNGKEIDSDYQFSLKAGDIINHLLSKPESEMVKCFHL
jgi:hypothetical protein